MRTLLPADKACPEHGLLDMIYMREVDVYCCQQCDFDTWWSEFDDEWVTW